MVYALRPWARHDPLRDPTLTPSWPPVSSLQTPQQQWEDPVQQVSFERANFFHFFFNFFPFLNGSPLPIQFILSRWSLWLVVDLPHLADKWQLPQEENHHHNTSSSRRRPQARHGLRDSHWVSPGLLHPLQGALTLFRRAAFLKHTLQSFPKSPFLPHTFQRVLLSLQ